MGNAALRYPKSGRNLKGRLLEFPGAYPVNDLDYCVVIACMRWNAL